MDYRTSISKAKDYDVIVVCELHSKKEIIEINEKCRKNNVKFVHAINRGCFSMIFNDFGDEFVVYDTNGETPKSFVVSGLSSSFAPIAASINVLTPVSNIFIVISSFATRILFLSSGLINKSK